MNSGSALKKIFLLIFSGIITIVLTNFPDFHPEKILGWRYSVSTDMLFHGGYYFCIGLLLFFSLNFNKARLPVKTGLLFIPAILEGTQYFVQGRSISVTDMVANYIGLSLAYVTWLILRNSEIAKKLTLS